MNSTQHIAETLSELADSQAYLSGEEWRRYVDAYAAHLLEDHGLKVDEEAAADQIVAHAELGLHRKPGQDLIRVVTPNAGASSLVSVPGSTLVQVVTTDRPLLVDTIAMEVRRQGWTLRRLEHPQLAVVRDEAGRLAAFSSHGDPESWISLELYPSLGMSAELARDDLVDGLRAALGEVRRVDEDRPAIEQEALLTAQTLIEGVPSACLAEAIAARSLLSWLLDGHFLFLGYEEYDYVGGDYHARRGSALGMQRQSMEPPFHAAPVEGAPRLLVMTKHSQRSTVYCPVHLDHVAVRRYGAAGELVSEKRFTGLLSPAAYTESIDEIPVVADKAAELLERSGYAPGSYGWNEVSRVIAGYPRDELFGATVDQLAPIVREAATLRNLRLVRTYLRRDQHGTFVTALVYLPRDRFTTESAEVISRILLEHLDGEFAEHTAWSDESPLTRLFYTVKLKSGARTEVDADLLRRSIEAAVTTWDDRMDALLAAEPAQGRGVDCGQSYPQVYSPEAAVADLAVANTLKGDDDLRYSLEPQGSSIRFKIFSHRERDLHELLPHLSALGAQVCDERPFTWRLRGRLVHIYDFGLQLPAETVSPATYRRFIDAFDAAYRGECESDHFNRLVLAAGLPWEEVVWLRTIGRFLKQAKAGFSQDYIAACLIANPAITTSLVHGFRLKFDPEGSGDWERCLEQIAAEVDQVASLDHDRILRMYLDIIRACTRTNAFLRADDIDIERALALKIASNQLELLPEPRPFAEIFVHSPRVAGVHLRFGKVARGGLRWSDRAEDFRTEVLGLVKAQKVKNAVIVPMGAKGGFVPQRLPDPMDRVAWLHEGTQCYRIFIAALLSVTDNLVGGSVTRPDRVLVHDEDDPYLVVAADKGTATFSDVANEISLRRGFWLGDAFASGGSAGYDHKAMGITAAGTWEAVKRHFAEMGMDPEAEDFTCVGVGDMSGDVFGNGMLSSRHIRLVAAFDHRHIFIDPEPDAAVSFVERRRLFELPRSSWGDYNPALISKGGGVYARSAKAIAVSAEAATALGLPDATSFLTADALVSAILRAPVDLLFNGGIGTYVKASHEVDDQVGDRANDVLRVDADQIRARCAAEGGNLGWTQAARVQFALGGGAINTDFIDNSAGVDCSDHEVNIKILLAEATESGSLSSAERDGLLASMTQDVAANVLRHNLAQNLALSNALSRALESLDRHASWMRELETVGALDRALEGLPTDAQLEERRSHGQGLTRPELAVLLAYTKMVLSDRVLKTDLPDDPSVAAKLSEYFPDQVRAEFALLMPRHRLAREIITTVIVNEFVDDQGITAFHRLSTETGASVADILRAHLAARAIFQVGALEAALDQVVPSDPGLSTRLRLEVRDMVERATRWLLASQSAPLDVPSTINAFRAPVTVVCDALDEILTPRQRKSSNARRDQWIAAGAAADLAAVLSRCRHAHIALSIVLVAQRLHADPLHVGRVYARLVAALHIDQLEARISALPSGPRWEALARASLREELLIAQAELAARAVAEGGCADRDDARAVAESWMARNPGARRQADLIAQACAGPSDVARMSVALGAVKSMLVG